MNQPLELLVDGAACGDGWPQDRALMYGDGLFETMLVRGGHIRFEERHMARLAEGCQRLAITADLPQVWSQARLAARRHGEATLRLQLTRGAALARGYTPTGAESARVILAVYAAPAAGELPARVKAVSLSMTLGENPVLAGLKHCNRLEQVLARLALRESSDAFEGLMASSSGVLVSGTMSNVFLELDGELVTPSVDLCGVAGVMREVVLHTAAQGGRALRIAALPFDVLGRCRALALSNARMGLVPVHELDGRALAADSPLHALAAQVAAQ